MYLKSLRRVQRVGALWLALPLSLGLLAVPAQAPAQDFPSRPIRLVVPFPPGGANDIVARVVAPKVGELLGQPVVVENKGGAAGTIGADFVAKSKPDGYTILMTPVPFVITQTLYPQLPYDGQKDFVPIALLTRAPFLLATPVGLPVRSLADLVALGKSKPGGIAFSSPGNGSPAHLAGELLRKTSGAQFVHVPYKGGGPAVADMIGGHVAFTMATPPEILPHVASGKARALAVTTSARTPLSPETPTVSESGYPGFEITVWYGVTAPRGTPPEIIERLSKAFAAASNTPEIRERMTGLGMEVSVLGPAEFGQFLRTEHEKWAQLVRESGAKPD